jgi:hypothetical protein
MKNTADTCTRSSEITTVLADAPEATDHVGVRKFARRLAGCGLAVLFIAPNSKVPTDCRAAGKKTADDRAAQNAARAVGRTDWKRAKSDSGVYLATTDTAVLDGYLNRYRGTWDPDCAVNLGVALAASRLVVIDADTPEQVEAWRSDAAAGGNTLGEGTVTTPGKCDPGTGEWSHHGGGHWYFTVPEGVELPESPGVWKAPGGYAVMWGGYVLTPPSVRDEGTYRTTGDVGELPDWLAAQIATSGRERIERAQRVRDRVSDDYDDETTSAGKIARWGAGMSWDDILTQHGWMATGRGDSTCGCPTYTAPGLHSSPKSATGHEFGCAGIYVESTDPPLHVWTTDPGEPFAAHIDKRSSRTVTRLWAVALLNHDGQIGEAMTAYDLHDDPTTLGDAEHQGDGDGDGKQSKGRVLRMTWAKDIADDVPTWAWEYDGYGRILRGAVCTFAGRPGAGKSTAARWFVAGYTTGRISGCFHDQPQRVAYLTSEESWEYTVKPGLRAAGADMNRVARLTVEMDGKTVKLLGVDDERAMIDQFTDAGISVVVVDPFMGTVEGKTDIYRPNEAREAAEPWQRISEAINGVVILVHHLVKAPNGDVLAGMQGASAFGELTRAMFGFVKADDDTRIMSQVKNSAGREGLSLIYELEAVEVTTDSGKTAEVARFLIVGASDLDVGDVLRQQARGGGGGSGGGSNEVALWLGAYLATGPRWAAPGYDAALMAGYSEDRVKRARRSCRIVSRKSGDRWYWATEEQAAADQLPVAGPPLDGDPFSLG